MDAISGGIGRPFDRLSDRVGGGGILAQRFVVPRASANGAAYSEDVAAPDGATHVFAELVAPGNAGSYSGGDEASGGGGGGGDAIVPVTSASVVSVALPAAPFSNSAVTATIKVDGVDAVTTTSGISSSASSRRPGTAGTGKYPGTAGVSNSSPFRAGQGGGRLAGKAVVGADGRSAGAGCGGSTVPRNGLYTGGEGQAMLTFFSDYDSALAFAKSVYGGSWAP